MFNNTELSKNITKNNQLPTTISLTSQFSQEDVRIQFKNESMEYSNHRPFMLTTSYVNQFSNEIQELVNRELFSLRALTNEALKSKKGINASVIVHAAVSTSPASDSLIGEKVRVEIKIPFEKCSNFKDFFQPVSQLFIPIAEYVQRFEIKASNYNLYHLHAFLTFSKDEILYVCQNPIAPCQKTKADWSAFLLKIYEQTLNSHTITFSIDCLDGNLILDNSLISLPAIAFEKILI